MPPRKSDASKVAIATADEGTPAKDGQPIREGINIEDLNLPKSIVTRLAKGVLPPNTQIAANAMAAMTKSATVFVNFVVASANEHASQNNRKTISPQDVFMALEDMEYPEFRDRIEAELSKFNEVQTDKRNAYRSKVANSKATGGSGEVGDDSEMADREGQPAAKKARLEGGAGGEEVLDGDQTVDEDEGEENREEDVPDEDEEEGEGEESRVEEEVDEEREMEGEGVDEALDNGGDSD